MYMNLWLPESTAAASPKLVLTGDNSKINREMYCFPSACYLICFRTSVGLLLTQLSQISMAATAAFLEGTQGPLWAGWLRNLALGYNQLHIELYCKVIHPRALLIINNKIISFINKKNNDESKCPTELTVRLNITYSCLVMPSKNVTICDDIHDLVGEKRRQSFVCSMILFGGKYLKAKKKKTQKGYFKFLTF